MNPTKNYRFAKSLIPTLLLIVSLASVTLASGNEPQAPAPIADAQVLILNSYHFGNSWSDAEQAAISDGLKTQGVIKLPIIEYLDFKRYAGGEHWSEMQALLRKKYQGKKLAVVIAMDEPALAFAVRNHQTIFGNAPVVFCGISNFHPGMLAGDARATGIVDIPDYAGTIEIMLRLHPDTREIFVLHDYTASGVAIRHDFEAVLPRFANRARFRFIADLPIAEIYRELDDLKRGSLVFLLNFTTDRAGKTFQVSEVGRSFSRRSKVPIYDRTSTRLGYGIVGGKLLNPQALGTEAVELAARILRGEAVENIPVVTRSTSQYLFDYEQLDRFHIPLSALPPASIIINRPAPFFAVNKGAMLGIIAIIVSLSLIICLLIINIIQRRRVTLALRESEAKYLDLYENAPDMYYSVDVKTGIIQKCNETFLRTTGYGREEVIGRPVFEFYGDVSREEAKQAFQRFATAGGAQNVERQVLRKDGSTMIVTLNVSAIRDAGGNIIASRSIWRDITEPKRAAGERVQVWNLVESSLNEIYIFDAKTLRFDYANFGALKNIGYTLEELQQRTPLDLKPEITEYAFHAICGSLINHESEKQVFRTVHRRKDGSLYPVEVHLQYIEQGAKQVFVTFILDITERKRSEDALLAAEKRFRDFLENIEQLTVMIDRNGNITFCNNYLLRLTGWSRYEVMQNNWFDLFQPGDVGMKIRSVFSSGISEETIPPHYENPIITRSGERRLIVWNNALLRDAEGMVTGMASIGIDVTEHRKLEEQLLQSQKMEAIGTLAGGVAHDFNNILTTILGCASLIRMQTEEADQQNQLAGEIIASVERATELTKSLLAFGRKQAVRMEPINLNDTIYNFQKILSRLIGEDIEFRVVLAGRGLVVEADKGQLEQVLMNVTANARDAMPEGGSLSIRTEEVAICSEAILEEGMLPGRYAVLTIADSGIGMAKNIRERIFEPFFTTKEVGKGTGLGLSMVYGIIKKHNGFIDVSSAPEKGTMFRIFLPLIDTAIQDEEIAVTEDEEILPRGNATILLVEDEEKVRSMTSLLLKNSGYQVLEAGDGEDALSVFRDHQDVIQLIITDVVMPRRNGKDMYEEINRIKADVPVIFMSGYAANIMGDGFFQREGIQYLQKPLKPALLLRTIQELAKSSGMAED